MKKFFAVLLAVLMVISVVPMMSFAAGEDITVSSLLNEDNYYHIQYVKDKNYFKTEIGCYTAFSLYDDAWVNLFTGSTDVANAKAILLGLIEQVEAEYNNETYEKVLSVLGTAKKAADVVEKIDSVTGILDLAENSDWATSMTVISTALKIANYGNEAYEKYVQAVATILSVKAASIYYSELLGYIAENCDDKNVKTAAAELQADVEKDTDAAIDEVLAMIAEDAASMGATAGIQAAMDTNTVTTVIKTAYNVVGTIGKKVFNTSDKYTYMSSLKMITKIEDILPEYVEAAITSGEAENFAVNALMTIRQTGESMLLNLGKVTEDTIANKLFKSYDKSELKGRAAVQMAKIDVMREAYNAGNAITSVATLYGPADVTVGDIAIMDGEESNVVTATGAYASIYEAPVNSYIKVIALFAGDAAAKAVASAGGKLDMTFENAAGTSYVLNKYISSARSVVVDSIVTPVVAVEDETEGKVEVAVYADYDSANADELYTSAPANTDASSGSSSSSSDSGSKKESGFAAFFKNLFASIKEAFAKLFSFGKK